jgi:hypothetical protein
MPGAMAEKNIFIYAVAFSEKRIVHPFQACYHRLGYLM